MRTSRRRTFAALAAGLATIAATSAFSQDHAASAAAEPAGMVDQPCPPVAIGRSAAAEKVARAMVIDGPVNSADFKPELQALADEAKAEPARKARDWANLCLYQKADRDDVQAGGVKVVFLGDSITEIWRLGDPALFTHGVVDRGVSGQTSGQILLRFYADVVALHPRVVHIMAGANDIAGNEGPNRAEDYKNNIRAMVDMAKANNIEVVLASILPIKKIPWRPTADAANKAVELNAWLSAYAKQRGLVYADYYTLLVGPDGGMRPGTSRDGVHPLRSAYLQMEPVARKALAKAEISPSRSARASAGRSVSDRSRRR